MIKIFKSNRLSRLATLLSSQLDVSAKRDPFYAPSIVVPNLDTARWLQLTLAEEMGFAGNLNFMLPAEWQWKQVRKLYPDLPDKLPSDPEPIKWAIFEVLINEQEIKSFTMLSRFIRSQPPEMREEAAIQLAQQLALLFDQYLIYRPDMIIRWQNGDIGEGDEKWQARLWNILDKRWKAMRSNNLSLNKAELYRETLNSLNRGELKIDGPVYIFNPGLVAEPIVRMIANTGKQADLYICLVQPAEGIVEEDHPLIASLGREAQSIMQLYDIPGSVTVSDFSVENTLSHLEQIQNSIISNESSINIDVQNGNVTGVEIHSCHTPLREIETLHNSLMRLFENDDSLHPDDILVMTPDLKIYQSAIHAVFGSREEGLPEIPYHIGSTVFTGQNGLLRAFLHLLTLPESRYSFSAVMDFFMMEPVRTHFRVSESEASTLKSWMEQNNVYWGLDEAHRAEWGQPAEYLQTWQSALERGWLGQWIGAEEGETVGDTLLFSGVRTVSDQNTWAYFSNFLRQLGILRDEAKSKRSCLEWVDRIEKWPELFFPEESLQTADGLAIMRALDSLRESCGLAAGRTAIGYPTVRKEIENKLDQQASGTAVFTRGVAFSTMVPVRSIPSKVIALIGLNEGTFPRKPTSPDFDLMLQYPRPTDRNRKNEDRNLFLESILAAQKIHYCSFIGRSPVDNEPVPPSPILSDWIDFLSKASGLKTEKLVQNEPLTGFSPAAFVNGKSYSKLCYEVSRKIVEPLPFSSGLKTGNPLPSVNAPEFITIQDLVSFYSNPARTFLRNSFDAYLRDADEEKDEFSLSNLDRHLLFEKVFGWVLNGISDKKMNSMLLKSGILPAGWPGERILQDMEESVNATIQQIRDKGFTPGQHREELSVLIGDFTLTGSIQSYADQRFLDVNLSAKSGKSLIQSWIKYLFYSAHSDRKDDESYLLCEAKTGDPKWIRFEKPQNPQELLKKMAELYRDGLLLPEKFFPKTLYEYESNMPDEEKAFKKAKETFEGTGNRHSYPERDDLNITFLMGEDASFDSGFVTESYREIMQQMMKHTGEIK